MHGKPFAIATILPHTEIFSPASAGGIALFVHETTVDSAYQDRITVYGRATPGLRPFSNVHFHGIKPALSLSPARGYERAVIRQLQQNPAALIEVHNNVNLFRAIRRAFPNTPLSLHLHDDPLAMTGAKTARERWDILSAADAIYCCSDFIRRRFLVGLEAGRTDHVHVVYSGVDAPVRGKKEAFILFTGRLAPEKGALEMARAAARVLPHYPAWKVVFVGANRPSKTRKPTKYAKTVEAVVKPLARQSVFLGHQPHHKVLELYARAAVAVVPTVGAEPFGRRAIEAMAAGCALITSGHGGLLEAAGDAGIVVSPVTADGLALALQGLIEDHDTLRAIQQQCFDRGAQFSLTGARQHLDGLRRLSMSQAAAA